MSFCSSSWTEIPFADALAEGSDSDAESNATLTLVGVQPSPKADETDVVVVDRDEDGVHPSPKAKGKTNQVPKAKSGSRTAPLLIAITAATTEWQRPAIPPMDGAATPPEGMPGVMPGGMFIGCPTSMPFG